MRRLALSVFVLGLFALPAWAQTNKALEIVPDDALGFILIKDLRALHDKAEDLAAKTNGKAHFAFVEGLLSKDLRKGLNEKGGIPRFLRSTTPDEVLRAMITRNGGEVVPFPDEK